jgi:hypothetical protein
VPLVVPPLARVDLVLSRRPKARAPTAGKSALSSVSSAIWQMSTSRLQAGTEKCVQWNSFLTKFEAKLSALGMRRDVLASLEEAAKLDTLPADGRHPDIDGDPGAAERFTATVAEIEQMLISVAAKQHILIIPGARHGSAGSGARPLPRHHWRGRSRGPAWTKSGDSATSFEGMTAGRLSMGVVS